MDSRLSTLAFLLTGFLLMMVPSMEIVLLGSELSENVVYALHNIGLVVLVVGAYFTIRDFIRTVRR